MIYSYGDSFTVGLGTDKPYEESLMGDNPNWENMSFAEKNEVRKTVHDFRIKNCFTAFFADKLNTKYYNKGYIGCNNNYILDMLVNDIVGGEVTDKDIVLINFSSSLRNYPAFFPHFFSSRPEVGAEGITFGEKEFHNNQELIEVGGHMKNTVLKRFNGRAEPFFDFLDQYKKIYVKQSFSFEYLDHYNQNLILFLQELLSHYGIKYLMFDAFDTLVNKEKVDFTKYINTSTYWEMGNKNIWSFLTEKNDETLLEIRPAKSRAINKKHPSTKGHKLFAEELYKFYTKKDGKVLI
jgi:hypothetical protein